MRKATQALILLLLSCAASSARAQLRLSTGDSASIALLIAESVAPSLRAVNGADSTNAVCSRSKGESATERFCVSSTALRSTTGGSLLAPLSISPLRGVVIETFAGAGDSARVNWRTTGGGLAKGEMAWAHQQEWRLVRRGSTWTVVGPFRGLFGDGYIRNDLPKPPNAPPCLAEPAG